jgi:hypothetical protein
MTERVTRLSSPPIPTRGDPHSQIKWIFFQAEGGASHLVVKQLRWAKEKYSNFVSETHAGYIELELDGRFYLTRFWEPDALIRFNEWLVKQDLASKTRYALYKLVRQVMTLAYGLRVIDSLVYHAPMFKGVSETNQVSAYLPDEQEVINAAIARWIGLAERLVAGYTYTGAGIRYRGAGSNLLGKSKKSKIRNIELLHTDRIVAKNYKNAGSKDSNGIVLVNGRAFDCNINGMTFSSIKELALFYGVKESTVRSRLLSGLTVEQAVGTENFESRATSHVAVSVEGVAYPSISAACRNYGIDPSFVGRHLRDGYSVDQAFGLVPRFVKQSDDRALLWSFENEYDCNPLLMMSTFIRHKMFYVCTTDRLRQLFIRWGVWAHIDDRLIMPLAVEFAMLTGLNVEAIKELDISCFQDVHPLTGKAVIHYRKKRSASSRRPVEKELHLPLLEMHDVHLDEARVEQIRRLYTLVLAITKSIRTHASESIAKRLFIFQDVERSNTEEEVVIVAIDPKRKAGKWYRRFTNDENLHAILGSNFSFNMARCRPTLVTNMVLAGADMLKIQSVLGHGSIQTTASYLDERQLKPAFHKTVFDALNAIAKRSSQVFTETSIQPSSPADRQLKKSAFAETLSGCGCADPYNPSDDVRKITFYREGSVCKFWNMCFFCDRAVITEDSLPKLIVYKNRISAALNSDAPSIRSRRGLYSDILKMIEKIVNTEEIFPRNVTDNARVIACGMDDILVDQLVYQGL